MATELAPSGPSATVDPSLAERNHRRLQLAARARREFLSGNVEQASQLAEQALTLDRDLFGEDDLRTAWLIRTLATYAHELEQPEKAIQ